MLALIASLTLGAATPLALYPVQPALPAAGRPGPDAVAVAAVDSALRSQIGDLRSYQLIAKGQTEALISSPGSLGLNCDDGRADCLASLGRLLNSSVVVFARVGAEGVELALVDVKTSQEIRRVHAEAKGQRSLVFASREACVALLSPDRYTGTVEVTGEHGRLAIDNTDWADLPLNGPVSLPVGRHQVTITLPGHTSWNANVDILWQQCAHIDGERAPLAAAGTAPVVVYTPQPLGEVPESRPPPHPAHRMSEGRRAAYIGLTAAVLAGAAGIICGAIAEDNVQALQQQTRPIPLAQATVAAQQAARSRDFGIAADAVWGTAAALGVASLVLYFVSPEYAPERPYGERGGSGRVEVTSAGALVRF